MGHAHSIIESTCDFQDDATSGLMSLIAMYPPTTLFYINSWTWGYEDVLKGIARAFQTKVISFVLSSTFRLILVHQIHVDRYKHTVYCSLKYEAYMRTIITRDASSTRFHACERYNRCERVKVNGQASHTPTGNHVVYVNPVGMNKAKWEAYLEETKAQLGRGEPVNNLVRDFTQISQESCPLTRFLR